MIYKVKFSYEDKVAEEVIIHSSKTRKRLLNHLLKYDLNITEVTILSQTK